MKQTRPLQIAGFILGFGMGGFFDGIVLHQLLQWHHLVSNVYPDNTLEGLRLNTLWDGIFHSAMYVITAVGLVLMWRAIRQNDVLQSPRYMLAMVLVGAGAFHIFDGIVNHWLLQIHHIRQGPDALLYDIAFFMIGVILVAVGTGLARTRRTV
jgi:uncharacterized membrane protein